MQMEANDVLAVAQAKAGNTEAFRALVERHSQTVFRVAYRMTANEQDAEDVVQETFIRAFRQLRRFEGRSSFATWVHRIAVNCSMDVLRRRSWREQPLETGKSGASSTSDPVDPLHVPQDRLFYGAEIRVQMTAALDRLSALERAAFVLRHVEGLSIEEIGQALGLRTSATKHSIFRAVRKMRFLLEPVARASGWH